ncbi:Uncharacterised protein [uncultured archaeon]|nr:Uncharacterised protein [uncultured archaeon]
MPKPEDIAEIIAWCEQKKKERQTVYVIDRNPFAMKFDWTRNIINIEIDRPLAVASKSSLVYDSIAKKLYQYMNNTWMPLNSLGKK